jgi:hypothetical protein
MTSPSSSLRVLIPLALALALTGCAAIEKANRANTERLLSAAGFRVVPANTAERQKSLAALEPYKVIRKLKGDEVAYVYSDPAQSILFLGTQDAYSQYRNLELQQEIANENMSAAQLNMSAATPWNDWPVWAGPMALPPPRMGPAIRR